MLTLADQITYFLLLKTFELLDNILNFTEMSIEYVYENPESTVLLATTAVFLQYLIASQTIRNNNRPEEVSKILTVENDSANSNSGPSYQASSSEGRSEDTDEEESYKQEDALHSEQTDGATEVKSTSTVPPKSSLYASLYGVFSTSVKTESVQTKNKPKCDTVVVDTSKGLKKF